MKRRYQIDQQRAVQEFRQLAREENPDLQMIFPMTEVVGLLQEGVGHLMREAGLALMSLVMEEEVRHLAGQNGTWITAHSLLSFRVFEQHIAGVGKRLAQQGGFSRTTWPGYDNRWELPRCVEKDRCQLPGEYIAYEKYKLTLYITQYPSSSALT